LATSAQLEGPIGLFVTRNNEIFISEYHGHRIRKHNNWYGQCTIEPFIKKNASSASIFLRVVSNDIEMTAWIDETMFIMLCPYSPTDATLNSQRIENMIKFIANGRSKSHIMNDSSLDGYSIQYRKIEPVDSCKQPANLDRFIYVLDKPG